MSDLKPCPFCGMKATLISTIHQVRCDNIRCDVMPNTWAYDTDDETIKAWNRRVGDE